MSVLPRELCVVLIFEVLPPVGEAVTMGMQDDGQEVPQCKRNGSFGFKWMIQALEAGGRKLESARHFVRGGPGARFLYLSWKRSAASVTPWLQRVKVPLTLTSTGLGVASAIRADIAGRRPHATEPIAWKTGGHC